MQTRLSILLLLLLTLEVSCKLNVISVSSSPDKVETPVRSSLKGGAKVYINLIGHSKDPSKISVTFGSSNEYTCQIVEGGVTDEYIVCVTPDSGKTTSQVSVTYQPLKVRSELEQQTISAAISYDQMSTPLISEFFPSSGLANQTITIEGTHRSTGVGSGEIQIGDAEVYVGTQACNRQGVEQAIIYGNVSENLNCRQAVETVAGKKNISTRVTSGWSQAEYQTIQASLEEEDTFQFTTLPAITNSTRKGSIGGQQIEIQGSGFSSDPNKNKVSVDSNPCEVSFSSFHKIKCKLPKRNNTLTSKLSSNSSNQTKGYASSAGVLYTRYSTGQVGNISDFVEQVREYNGSAYTLKQQTVKTEIKVGDAVNDDEGEVWKAYFTAPRTGTYTFRGINTNGTFEMYLSSVHGSTQLPQTPLIYSYAPQQGWKNFFYKPVQTAAASIDLTQNQSYYFQVYNIRGRSSTGSKFKISVEVPNNNTKLKKQVHQIDRFTLNSNVQPQVIQYTFIGGRGDSANISLIRTNSKGQITYNKERTLLFGSSAENFSLLISQFESFSEYEPNVTSLMFDSNGKIVTAVSCAAKIEYNVSLFKLRPQQYQQQQFTITLKGYTDTTFTQRKILSHSPLVSGTFSMTFGGTESTRSLQSNISAVALQQQLRKIEQLSNIEVDSYSQLGPGYDNVWLISYKGYYADVPPVYIDANLTGGATTPTVTRTVLRNYSSNIAFDSIDYRFLSVPSDEPAVKVITNDIPAVCVNNCTYQFMDLFNLVNFTMYQSALILSITNPTAINVSMSQMDITLDDNQCTVTSPCAVSNTYLYVMCQLQTDQDGAPILPAGNFTPEILIGQHGYVDSIKNVTPIAVPFNVTKLTKKQGNINGGYVSIVVGSGFFGGAKNKEEKQQQKQRLRVALCGKNATIRAITNKQIHFYVPQCDSAGPYTVTVSDGTYENTDLTFTYEGIPPIDEPLIPKINSISPTTSNPKKKTIMNITGVNFGTNLSAVNVSLYQADGQTYPLRVIQVTDTLIKCELTGGMSGLYQVIVNYPEGEGDALLGTPGVNNFSYSFHIDSVSPTQGSLLGGTLLTITGQNFLADQDKTQVYIGTALNWFCTIQSLTQTQITCLTPPMHPDYTPETPLEVLILTKPTAYSTCPNNGCSFSYMNLSFSANVTSVTKQTLGAQTTLQFEGHHFTTNSVCSISFRNKRNNKITTVSAETCNQTFANLTVSSNLQAGDYYVSVKNEYGDSNPNQVFIPWYFGNPSSMSVSTAGAYISLTDGSGYPAELGGDFIVRIEADKDVPPVQILHCCTNNYLQLWVPPSPDNTGFTIFFQYFGSTDYINFTSAVNSTLSVTITSPSLSTSLSPGPTSFVLTWAEHPEVYPGSLSIAIYNITFVSTQDQNDVIQVSNWDNQTYNLTTFDVNMSSGMYRLVVNSTLGIVACEDIVKVTYDTGMTTADVITSLAGGNLTIIGQQLSPSSYITVNGLRGYILNYSENQVNYQLPKYVTPDHQANYAFETVKLIESTHFRFSGDSSTATDPPSAVFDGDLGTVYESPQSLCWVGADVGDNLTISVARIRFFPKVEWRNTISKLLGGQFQGSNDQSTWTLLAQIDQTVHTGWNTFPSLSSTPFRYIRFSHTSASKCSLAELQFYGIVYSAMVNNPTTEVYYHDAYNIIEMAQKVTYSESHTPVVERVTPEFGDVFGGYNITIEGTNLGFDSDVIVDIDGIQCVAQTQSNTQIICLVGQRLQIPSSNTFSVKIGQGIAVIKQPFRYVQKWSDIRTWANGLPPIDGDLVVVPKGMTLLIDQDTPQLAGIAVQNGTIMFSNDTSIHVKTGFITVVGGQFIAGTQTHPLHSNLTIELFGDYYDPQQPIAGNKGIFCLQCKLSLHGKPRSHTWTTLRESISRGDDLLKVNGEVDWQLGDKIVLAGTRSWTLGEERTVVSSDGMEVTIDPPFPQVYFDSNAYIGVEESFSGTTIKIQAQVILLSRNIKITGDPTSATTQYGSHLKLYGSQANGLQAKIAYTEFTLCGQPQIPGRDCIYFQMNGEVPNSYVKGNSVHQSYGRVVTMQGVHMLRVQDNVGYRARGHNYLLVDGSQTRNIIKNNVAIITLRSNDMLYTDQNPASFMITNPSNDIIGNRAAGSQYCGFWYHFANRISGPSTAGDICPDGLPLGQNRDNVIHSNTYFGMRLFRLIARKYPCAQPRNDSYADDPWKDNPAIRSLFYNYTIYNNNGYGVAADETGYLAFDRFHVMTGLNGNGIQFFQANFTKQHIQISNSVVLGLWPPGTTDDYMSLIMSRTVGLVTPRTGFMNLTSVRFYNFLSGMKPISLGNTLASYDSTDQGTQLYITDLHFENITTMLVIQFGLMKNDVVYDLDGSLKSYFNADTATKGTLVYHWNHIANYHNTHCTRPANANMWPYFVYCDQTVTLRRIWMTNPIANQSGVLSYSPYYSIGLYIYPLQDQAQSSSNTNSSHVSYIHQINRKMNNDFAWSLPYVAGMTYQAKFNTSYDFYHLSIVTTPTYQQQEPGVVFKFIYDLTSQAYNVGPMRGGSRPNSNTYKAPKSTYVDPLTCENGDYFHNNTEPTRMLSVCQSGKNRSLFQYTQITSVYCINDCPVLVPPPIPPSPCDSSSHQTITRLWSNASMWPNQTVPQPGDDVEIDCDWTVLIDVPLVVLGELVVDGDLIVDDTIDINITAEIVHIRMGSLTVGNQSTPFTHQFVIQINGKQTSSYYSVDPLLEANKLLAVTGNLTLYGKVPATTQTILTKSATNGSTKIYVQAHNQWQVGDRLALLQEVVQIVSINSTDKSIVITPPLKYTHYGNGTNKIVPTGMREVETRTAVGHLTRNVRVVSGGDQTWGYHISVYRYYYKGATQTGNIQIKGVQFLNGGQSSSARPCLQFKNIQNPKSTSTITSSTFSNCLSDCVSLYNSQKISIAANIFAGSKGSSIQSSNNGSYITIKDNLMMGVKTRYSSPGQNPKQSGCFTHSSQIKANDYIAIEENRCIGSQYGFILPHLQCADLTTHRLKGNVAVSCSTGFKFNDINQACQGFSNLTAVNCKQGHHGQSATAYTLKYSHFVLLDNQKGVNFDFKGLKNSLDNTVYLSDSFISAISRPYCAQCYGFYSCKDMVALQMLSVIQDESIGIGIDNPNNKNKQKLSSVDAKVFLSSVIVQGYRNNYNNSPFAHNPSIIKYCRDNFVFKPQSQFIDVVGGHYLTNSECLLCSPDSYVKCDYYNYNRVPSTARSHYIIQDMTGTFLGGRSTIIPDNPNIGDNQANCTKNTIMNAHLCHGRHDFVTLEFDSRAPDYNTRIVWPVNLTSNASNYTTIVNGWRQWEQTSNAPLLDTIISRFLSIIKLYTEYSIHFAAMPPLDMVLQIQKRTPQGDPSSWVILQISYPVRNSIRAYIGGTRVSPVINTNVAAENGLNRSLNTSVCGDNVYFYQNKTIKIVLTEESSCVIRLSVAESIQLTTNLAMDANDFFTGTVMSNFITNLCALLGIVDENRVKVVGVYSGSAIIQTVIEAENDTQAAPGANTTMSQLSANLTQLIANGTFSSFIASGVGYPVISASGSFFVMPGNEQVQQEDGVGNGVIYGIIGGAVAAAALVITIVIYICIRRKRLAKVADDKQNPRIQGQVIELPDYEKKQAGTQSIIMTLQSSVQLPKTTRIRKTRDSIDSNRHMSIVHRQ